VFASILAVGMFALRNKIDRPAALILILMYLYALSFLFA